jgi:16S rRNA (cytidine1402-2'-O)-methyltransferase
LAPRNVSGNIHEMSAVIYIVATPIGNLDDLTPRARATLASVDVIAAEDTRNTRKLLSHLGIQGKKLVSYHDHGETERAEALLDDIEARGQSLAVVSDAGTPCIADPGYRIVAAAKSRGIKVHPVPGPSSLTALVSASGLPSNRVLFVGFLPQRAKPLAEEIASWAGTRASIVFFEATRRLERTLAQIAETYPTAEVAVGRELTKLFEEIVRLPVLEAKKWIASHASLKGEATVMVTLGEAAEAPQGEPVWTEESLVATAKQEFQGGATLKDLLRKYRDAGFKRTELYALLLQAKD